MINIQPYIDRLEALKEWMSICIEGNVPYFKGVYVQDIVFKRQIPDDKWEEYANDFNIWFFDVVSPAKMAVQYPFEDFLHYIDCLYRPIIDLTKM